MARNARPVLPIDLLALVSYKDKVYPNEARPRERIGAADPTPNPFETALDQWFSFATRRNAWISARRQRLLGLVSARRRGGRQAWEIDCLIDTTPGHTAVPGLLECAIQAGGNAGAEKIFLRLGANSELLPLVTGTGFVAYQSERLYAGSALALPAASEEARPVSQGDMYPLFRLYNAAVPERSRRAEAATFAEWQAAQERQWLKGGVQLVLDNEGGPSAAVRAARLSQGLLADVVVSESARGCRAALLSSAIKAAGSGAGPVMVLVPEHDPGLASELEGLGFEAREEFASLMCRTTRVARLPKLAPAALPSGAVMTS